MSNRQQIDEQQRMKAAQSAAKNILENKLFKSSQHIGCYLPVGAEFDCKPIIEAVWSLKKKCYLPMLPSQTKKMEFVLYRPNDDLRLNRYHILEPTTEGAISAFDIKKLDLVIVPLVGFDLSGNRLGRGGGYYDFTFSFLKNNRGKPLLIGLGFVVQQTIKIPADEWDIQLDGILTEKQFLIFDDAIQKGDKQKTYHSHD